MVFSRQDASILGLPISKSVANGNTVLLAATEAVAKLFTTVKSKLEDFG